MNKSIFDIHAIDVYFTSVYSNPSVFDTSSVAKISNSKRELQNKQRLVKGEVTMCVGSGSKIDMIVGERSNFKNFLCTRKIMVMHSNERGECDLRPLVDRQRKR